MIALACCSRPFGVAPCAQGRHDGVHSGATSLVSLSASIGAFVCLREIQLANVEQTTNHTGA